MLKKSQFLWVSQSSWMEFGRNELEAWLVDAPTGDHIIIVESQNDVEINYQCPSGVTLELWEQKKLALLIGYSVLENNDLQDLKEIKEIEQNHSELEIEHKRKFVSEDKKS